MINLEICNMAIGLTGGGRTLTSIDQKCPEAAACSTYYQAALEECLTAANWSFCRKDELITEENLLKDEHGQIITGATLPYAYSYEVPEDVIKILYLSPYPSSARTTETLCVNHNRLIPFNLRNVDNRLCLATDATPPFEIHYQARLDEFVLVTPAFKLAAATRLASLIAPMIIGGVEGINMGIKLEQMFQQSLTRAAAIDAQQGAYSVTSSRSNRFIEARR